MPGEEYAAVPITGKLKLKGAVQSGRVDKKKKRRPKPEEDLSKATDQSDSIAQAIQEEDQQITKESRRNVGIVDAELIQPGSGVDDEYVKDQLKTETERKFDEQRRKRLEERLKREGVKSHKQRVEELNRYLSSLSEHNDMPKIGPG